MTYVFAQTIYDTLKAQEVASIEVFMQGYLVKLLFEIKEIHYLIIGLVPQEPYVMKAFEGNVIAWDIAFYIEKSMELVEGFFIYSLYAEE
jgi:hypothetical protein